MIRRTVTLPVWAVLVAVVAVFAAGFVLAGSRPGSEHQGNGLSTGVVDSIDRSSGTICIRGIGAGGVQCYQAPAAGVTVGDQIRFRVEQVDVDPSDSSKGTRATIVYAVPD